jgi:hypothetical protein
MSVDREIEGIQNQINNIIGTNTKIVRRRKNNEDISIVYYYKCKVKSFKDIIDASKIMLTNNIKVLKTVNNSKIYEWELYTFSKIDASDIGDMENDPFVKKLLEMDGHAH